jgi:hypothetical protein
MPIMCGYAIDGERPLEAAEIARIEAVHDRSVFEAAATPERAPEGVRHYHAVRFYDSDQSLARIVTQFLGDGFASDQPAILIATREHRDAIAALAVDCGFDLGRLEAEGELILADAAETLAPLMCDGMPDAERFTDVMVGFIDRARRGRPHVPVRAYGEMVDLLWKAGQTAAAIRLEMLWNQLAQTHDFALLCGYSMGNFYKGAAQAAIRAQHTHELIDSGTSVPLS